MLSPRSPTHHRHVGAPFAPNLFAYGNGGRARSPCVPRQRPVVGSRAISPHSPRAVSPHRSVVLRAQSPNSHFQRPSGSTRFPLASVPISPVIGARAVSPGRSIMSRAASPGARRQPPYGGCRQPLGSLPATPIIGSRAVSPPRGLVFQPPVVNMHDVTTKHDLHQPFQFRAGLPASPHSTPSTQHREVRKAIQVPVTLVSRPGNTHRDSSPHGKKGCKEEDCALAKWSGCETQSTETPISDKAASAYASDDVQRLEDRVRDVERQLKSEREQSKAEREEKEFYSRQLKVVSQENEVHRTWKPKIEKHFNLLSEKVEGNDLLDLRTPDARAQQDSIVDSRERTEAPQVTLSWAAASHFDLNETQVDIPPMAHERVVPISRNSARGRDADECNKDKENNCLNEVVREQKQIIRQLEKQLHRNDAITVLAPGDLLKKNNSAMAGNRENDLRIQLANAETENRLLKEQLVGGQINEMVLQELPHVEVLY